MVGLFGLEDFVKELSDGFKEVAGEVTGGVKELGDELKDSLKLEDND